MRRLARRLLLAGVTLALSALGAADAPPSGREPPSEKARLDRGTRVREVLLGALEQAYANDGVWPERLPLPSAGGLGLAYVPPGEAPDPKFPEEFAGATVVLHERVEERAGGVWVGYADGHLEFARSAEDLAGCMGQVPIVRAAIATHGGPDGFTAKRAAHGGPAAAQPAGDLRVRVLDPEGRPVAGALVGRHGRSGDLATPAERVTFPSADDPRPEVTGADGEATVPAGRASPRGFAGPAAALYVLHEGRGLVALEEVRPADFDGGRVMDVRLHPGCRVSGGFTRLGSAPAGPGKDWADAVAYKPGRWFLGAVSSSWSGGALGTAAPARRLRRPHLGGGRRPLPPVRPDRAGPARAEPRD